MTELEYQFWAMEDQRNRDVRKLRLLREASLLDRPAQVRPKLEPADPRALNRARRPRMFSRREA